MRQLKFAAVPFGRTKLLTVAAVAAISITGAAAVGANIGLLDTASATATGELAAAGDLLQGAGGDFSGSSTTVAPAGTARFSVDQAGTVTLTGSSGRVRLELIEPTPGWTWVLSQTASDRLLVTFQGYGRVLELHAVAGADGAVSAAVTETLPESAVTTVASAAVSSPVAPSVGVFGWASAPAVASPPAPATTAPVTTSATRYDDDQDDPDDPDDDDHYEGGDDDD